MEEVVEGVISTVSSHQQYMHHAWPVLQARESFLVVLIVETLSLKMPSENCYRSMYSRTMLDGAFSEYAEQVFIA